MKTIHAMYAFLWSLLLMCSMHAAVVNWIHDPNITADVCDDDLCIAGMNQLGGPVTIKAVNDDVTVFMQSDAVITGRPASPQTPRLYLKAQNGHTITFDVSHILSFLGFADNGPQHLLVSVATDGSNSQIRFVLSDEQEVHFASQADTGGARVIVVGGSGCQLRFDRDDETSDADVCIVVDERSSLGYAAMDANDVGCIVFDPSTTSDTARMRLKINDAASVVVRSHAGQNLDGLYTLADIDRSQSRGSARFTIVNDVGAVGTAGLLLENRNTVLPQLAGNFFCDDQTPQADTPQPGFILGANGTIDIGDGYLDYVGLATQACPSVKKIPLELQDPTEDLATVKERNASALIVDGDPSSVTKATMLLNNAAVVFRSGVDQFGVQQNFADVEFAIDPLTRTPGAGNAVLSVEGALDVIQLSPDSKLEILSLAVAPTGGSILVGGSQENFPLRTFETDDNGSFVQYNAGYFFINGRLNLIDTNLVHTDEIHLVFEKDFTRRSEPTYVGGDNFKIIRRKTGLSCNGQRPKIVLDNSRFHVQTNVALTGVDILVPDVLGGNESCLIFYNNGFAIDAGNGRQFVLGTELGAKNCCGTLFDRESFLDVVQEGGGNGLQALTFKTAINDCTITKDAPCDTADIENQCAIQTVYLNYNSNMCIGTLGQVGLSADCTTTFELTTTASVTIDGTFFSFETLGGDIQLPELSNVTGKGGIFVDNLGRLAVVNNFRVAFSTMITLSEGAVVDLPSNQVFFGNRVGVGLWQQNLAERTVMIPVDTCVSQFNVDWVSLKKNFAGGFEPYVFKQLPLTPCDCPPVTQDNLISLPTVLGKVDQLNIKRSRIGDPVHLLVDGGRIKETLFLTGFDSAEAPVGVLVVQNFGRLGLGSAHRTVDSLQGSIRLGVNGVSLIANGNGVIEVNEDLLIDNVCHILKGPDFSEGDKLVFRSNEERELRVKSTGLLDLTQFTDGCTVEFAGNMKLIFEPGARLVLAGGTLRFTDESQIIFERVVDPALLIGAVPSDLDDVRVKISGIGTIQLEEHARFDVDQQTVVGIETFGDCITQTNLTIEISDNACGFIGTQQEPGGALQVGNVTEQPDASVSFNLVLKNVGSKFTISREGFFGLVAGVARKDSRVPQDWLVCSLYNVGSIGIDIQSGTFNHNQIAATNDTQGSLIVIGPTGDFTYSNKSLVRGGGNVMLLQQAGCFSPAVLAVDGNTGLGFAAGLLGSTALQLDAANVPLPQVATGQQLFTFLKTKSYPDPDALGVLRMRSPKANFTCDAVGRSTVGYVLDNVIVRDNTIERIMGGTFADPVSKGRSLRLAAVGLGLHPLTKQIDSLIEIRNE